MNATICGTENASLTSLHCFPDYLSHQCLISIGFYDYISCKTIKYIELQESNLLRYVWD